jgi:hypothetical protein
MVRPQQEQPAGGVGELGPDVGLLQHRQQIGCRVLPPVHLAGLHRGGLGSLIRLDVPLDAVEMHDLADLNILTRLVLVETFIDERRPLHTFIDLKRNGPLPTTSANCLNGSVSAIIAGS